MIELSSLRREVETVLTDFRLAHTLGVERECTRLAAVYGFSARDTIRLRVAALLHDITKQCSKATQFSLIEQYGIVLSPAERHAPPLLHALTGAAVAADRYAAYTDPEICEAIRIHTVAKAGMSCFEKLLYLADFIEETRTFPDCVALRSRFWESIARGEEPLSVLDETLLTAFDQTISLLLKESAVLAPETCSARNDLLIRRGN